MPNVYINMDDELMTTKEQVMLEQALLRRTIQKNGAAGQDNASNEYEKHKHELLQSILQSEGTAHEVMPEAQEDEQQSPITNNKNIFERLNIDYRWLWAAAAVIVVLIAARLYAPTETKPAMVPPVVEELLADNKLDATLNAQNMTTNKTPITKVLEIAVPVKKIYHFTLPDGTQVWLNSESQLYYPAEFNGDERRVRLVGEGFFDVKKNPDKPFVVESEKITTKAYGTSFNMRTYADEECRVTLLDGMVVVENDDNRVSVQLLPGEDAQLVESGGFQVRNFDTANYERWNNGYFYYDNTSLHDVLHDISRWYGVELLAEGDENVRVHFVARWDEMPLTDVIDLLKSFTGVNITIK